MKIKIVIPRSRMGHTDLIFSAPFLRLAILALLWRIVGLQVGTNFGMQGGELMAFDPEVSKDL